VTLKIDSEHSSKMQKFSCFTLQKCRRKPSSDEQVCKKPHILFTNVSVDTIFIVKDAKITQTHIRGTSCHSVKLHLKQVFETVYRYELETKLS